MFTGIHDQFPLLTRGPPAATQTYFYLGYFALVHTDTIENTHRFHQKQQFLIFVSWIKHWQHIHKNAVQSRDICKWTYLTRCTAKTDTQAAFSIVISVDDRQEGINLYLNPNCFTIGLTLPTFSNKTTNQYSDGTLKFSRSFQTAEWVKRLYIYTYQDNS